MNVDDEEQKKKKIFFYTKGREWHQFTGAWIVNNIMSDISKSTFDLRFVKIDDISRIINWIAKSIMIWATFLSEIPVFGKSFNPIKYVTRSIFLITICNFFEKTFEKLIDCFFRRFCFRIEMN